MDNIEKQIRKEYLGRDYDYLPLREAIIAMRNDLEKDLDTYMKIANDITSREGELVEFIFKELTSRQCDLVTRNYLIEEFNKTLDK